MFGIKQQPTIPSKRDLVLKGAALLDRVRPGWEKGVDVETLDIRSHNKCVLGQTYGDYRHDLDVLRLKGGQEYGFNSYRLFDMAEFMELNREWAAEIIRRQKKVKANA